MSNKVDPVEGAIQTLEEANAHQAQFNKLSQERQGALAMKQLTRQPGWLYLKKQAEAIISVYRGSGLAMTEQQLVQKGNAMNVAQAFELLFARAEKANGEPQDEAEKQIMAAMARGEATKTTEIEHVERL